MTLHTGLTIIRCCRRRLIVRTVVARRVVQTVETACDQYLSVELEGIVGGQVLTLIIEKGHKEVG